MVVDPAVVVILAGAVVALAAAFAVSPVGHCDKCPHCQTERHERERRRHLEMHRWNLCVDPACPYRDDRG